MSSFSIIIPTYNRQDSILRTCNSVIGQTCSNWEMIIVDDGSEDDTISVLENVIHHNSVRYFYKQRAERSIARNYGLKLAKNDYVIFLDSDDYLYKNYLEEIDKIILKSDDVEMCISICDIEQNGVKIPIENLGPLDENYIIELWNRPNLPIQTFCVSRQLLLKYLFNDDLNIWEDLELWFRILIDYKPVLINNILSCVCHRKRDYNTRDVKSFMVSVEILKSNRRLILTLGQNIFMSKVKSTLGSLYNNYQGRIFEKILLKFWLFWIYSRKP